MAVFTEPTQWDHELGNNADVSTLPDDTGATTGKASLQKLFQLINQTPLEAGGVAPEREDFNALFKILGDSIFYMQNGGLWSYNSAFDYAIGRVVLYTDGNIYKCIQTNGASSTVVAPDSVDPDYLGTDYWEKLATLSDFANFANTDLTNATPTSAFANAMNSAQIRTVVETYSNGSSWYRVYSDGWCEQGGEGASFIPNSSKDLGTISLLKNFTDTNYQINFSIFAPTNSSRVSGNLNFQKNTSSFGVYLETWANNTSTNYFSWTACGYIS